MNPEGLYSLAKRHIMKQCCKLTAGQPQLKYGTFFFLREETISCGEKKKMEKIAEFLGTFKQRQDAFLVDSLVQVTNFATEVKTLPTSPIQKCTIYRVSD